MIGGLLKSFPDKYNPNPAQIKLLKNIDQAFTDGYKSVSNSNLMKNLILYLADFNALICHFADVNELSPIKDFQSYNFLAAKLVYKILSYKFVNFKLILIIQNHIITWGCIEATRS